MKKLVFIVQDFPSKTEHFISNELKEFERIDFPFELFVLRKNRDLSKEILHKTKITYLPNYFFYLPVSSFFFYPKYLKIFSKLFGNKKSIDKLKLLRDFSIAFFYFKKLDKNKLYHFHAHFAFLPSDIAVILSLLLKDSSFSMTTHASDIYRNNQNKLKELINKSMFVITCTKYNLNFLNKLTNNKFIDKNHCVYHGIDTSGWKDIKEDEIFIKKEKKINIVSVGRLIEKKGYIFLLKSLKLLKQKGINFEFDLIGEGPLKNGLEEYTNLNNLGENVNFIGFKDQKFIKKELPKYDIFILPSIISNDKDRDGLPNVILEAMVSGLPVISTKVSAIPELINNETGILVEPRNEYQIYNAILNLIDNKSLYNTIKLKAKERINRDFELKKSTHQLSNLFNKYLEAN